MKKLFRLMTLGLCMSVVISCGSAAGNGTLIGAGGGALVGAIVGKLAGNTAVGAAVGAGVGAAAGNIIGHHMDKVKAKAQQDLSNVKVEEITDDNGLPAVRLTFDGGILFATNKAELNATAQGNLQKLAKIMNNYNECDVAVYGHTDSKGTDAVNNPLSVNRATSVANFLTQSGAKADQIKTVAGCGSKKPIADNATEAGRQQNRRVEVYMYASEKLIKDAKAQAERDAKK